MWLKKRLVWSGFYLLISSSLSRHPIYIMWFSWFCLSFIWLFKCCMFFVMLILKVTVLLLQSLSCHLYDLLRTMIKQLLRLVASTSWDICFCFVPGHWQESITCFSSINVTDLNVPSSIQLHRDFILTFWACLNFYVNMMKIYLILHSILESLHKSLEPQASSIQPSSCSWSPTKQTAMTDM